MKEGKKLNDHKHKVTWKNNQESMFFVDYASAQQMAHTIAFFYIDVYINKTKYERI